MVNTALLLSRELMEMSYLIAKPSRERGTCELIWDCSACTPYGARSAIGLAQVGSGATLALPTGVESLDSVSFCISTSIHLWYIWEVGAKLVCFLLVAAFANVESCSHCNSSSLLGH